jgi:hypothetical protein
MTQITPVDNLKRLWQVEDLISAEELTDLLSVDWLSVDWKRGPGQEGWKRRLLDWDRPEVIRVNQHIQKQLPKINAALGTNYTNFGGQFWLDEPGFDVAIHTDGELPSAMQMYWVAPDETYGTGFYFYRSTNTLQHQFMSRPNTGYILLNHVNEDGSQPLFWHGMFNTVPEGAYRLSSYWYLS